MRTPVPSSNPNWKNAAVGALRKIVRGTWRRFSGSQNWTSRKSRAMAATAKTMTKAAFEGSGAADASPDRTHKASAVLIPPSASAAPNCMSSNPAFDPRHPGEVSAKALFRLQTDPDNEHAAIAASAHQTAGSDPAVIAMAQHVSAREGADSGCEIPSLKLRTLRASFRSPMMMSDTAFASGCSYQRQPGQATLQIELTQPEPVLKQPS